MMQNPAYKENLPMIQTLAAHIQDHLAMKYKGEVIQMIQDPQLRQAVGSGQQLPPEIENQIALDEEKRKIMAGEKKDPQEEQVEIQKEDLELRKAKLALDAKKHQDEIALEEAKVIIDDENTDLERERKMTKDAMDMAKDGIRKASVMIKREGM